MEPPVIAALISGTSSLIGGSLATHFVSRFLEQRDLPSISKDRRIALNGRWQGVYHQDVGPSGGPTDYAMKADFTAKKKAIMAKIEMVLSFEGTTYHIAYDGKGSYVDNRFIKMEYESADPGVMQFGFMILEYSTLGYTLTGRFVAFGAITERLVSGNINLQKIIR
jgi:hypothetical protein